MIDGQSKKKRTTKRSVIAWGKQSLFSRKKKEGKGPFVSLRVKFAVVLLFSAIVTVCLTLLLLPLISLLVTNFYMQPDRANDRLDGYINNFSSYVAEEQILSDDAAAVAQWSVYHRNVHLVVFGGDEPQFGVADGEILAGDDTPEISDPIFTESIYSEELSDTTIGNTYVVRFADRYCSVSVVDYTGSMVHNTVMIFGSIVVIAIFLLTLVLYYHSQIKAIVTLSREVEQISDGVLSAEITSHRNDEIGGLARDVDTMRTTILKKIDEEKTAREANGELLTSMSHDIRTPLTTLLGYMELLQNENDNMTPEQRSYVQLCAEKAGQIKELSDKLFMYFWAHNIHEGRVDTESCDGVLLVEQMIGEWLLPMETEGVSLEIQATGFPVGTSMPVNTDCLRRIIDNIFDNIRKYAQKPGTVQVIMALSDDPKKAVMIFRNSIGHPVEKTSGTHIGHKTCAHLAELMGGRFEAVAEKEQFEARLYLPIDHP